MRRAVCVDQRVDRAHLTARVLYRTPIATEPVVQSIGLSLYHFMTWKYDQNAERPTRRPGDCTQIKKRERGDNCIVLTLRAPIFVSGLTVEYIVPRLIQKMIYKLLVITTDADGDTT